ncbi:MAG TPA: response regulator transcription factor [Jatrophihabitans sp.]|jgi:DNA-binding response OmpR family regulator|uniref:response regulator transcription factor n=1 Tax=Jatrophihabitans sp. TaxID=1932789 RepID=UPI002DFFCD88|nr:response regulator transcription factor [Jatrophihabitans sp.]
MRPAVVIEPDPQRRRPLVDLLGECGFVVIEAGDGRGGLAAVRTADPDLVTVDLSLSDPDGIEVCRQVRALTDAYVVVLSARLDEIGRVVGLEAGADDFMATPVNPREFRARVNAMLRRPRRPGVVGAPVRGTVLCHDDLEVDLEARTARRGDEEVELTRTEFDLLATLLAHPNRAWARDALLRSVWGSNWSGDTHLVEVHVGNLRRKLGDDSSHPRYIKTVRGVGYRMVTPARV